MRPNEELQNFYKSSYQPPEVAKLVVQDRKVPDGLLTSRTIALAPIRLINGSNDDMFQIFCYVLGSGSPFPVNLNLAKRQTVGGLKRAIRKKKEHTFADVDHDTLVLSKVSLFP
jgi:hypothetical protein